MISAGGKGQCPFAQGCRLVYVFLPFFIFSPFIFLKAEKGYITYTPAGFSLFLCGVSKSKQPYYRSRPGKEGTDSMGVGLAHAA